MLGAARINQCGV
jgi:hypothetical protein